MINTDPPPSPVRRGDKKCKMMEEGAMNKFNEPTDAT